MVSPTKNLPPPSHRSLFRKKTTTPPTTTTSSRRLFQESLANIASKMFAKLIAIVVATSAVAGSLIGYNCRNEGLNITTLSLLDVGTCNIENIEPEKSEVYLQLMQLSDYDKIPVMQCRMEVDRTVYYCGMSSHISIVNGGRKQYLQELGADTCKRMLDTRSIVLATAVIDRLEINSTNWRSVTLTGHTTTEGRCSGSQYTDGYGTWDNVVVQAVIKITLRTLEASRRRSTEEVILPSGVHCRSNANLCTDLDGAETYWKTASKDSCHFDDYDILYEGTATKLSSKTEQSSPTVFTVTTRDTTFALTKVEEFDLCGYRLFRTEHPKLVILETSRGRTFKARSRITVDNLDIFSYVNSKFVYVEKHIKNQLTRLYQDIMEQKCALERQILQNALSLSSIAPDEMAFRIMKEPGYTAVTAGEVIHLIKCVAVECRIRHTEDCYDELPVTYRNESLFLLPRSRILTKQATPRDCNELLPTMYKIHGTWFRISDRPTETLPPPTIQPLTHPRWKYVSPASLATSGIYTTEDLNRLKNHIMFPVERPSTLNTIARGAMGGVIPPGSISMLNLLDEKAINHIAESAGKRAWEGFVTFGSASAGVLAIFVILRLIKLIIDTIIHGYALHSIYGWSIHLLAAIWSALAHLLIHLGRPSTPTKYNAVNIEQPKEDHQPQAAASTAPLPSTTDNDPRETMEIYASPKPRSYNELRNLIIND